ncbi:T9SS type A sorting domain-containing protein [Pedobacter frigiditerrae]|uniref:T9SS type A sorting domain-containing protein n=1 Tax=Pedobacter frigiditerrae TaxID=2530452 RepID=A0A4R0MP81_9SPHI|nr:T9SS type A sorting domain-containing protein [Pedobacter frigiditerrae]TCC88649.1 T9SS type A sorting domain-containing protein [Pedobacter frigiditerrae]
MKYSLILGLIVLSLCVHAQTLRVNSSTSNGVTKTDSLWYTHQEYLGHVFGNLNFAEVTSNFLIDRAPGKLSTTAHDGKNSNDSTIRSTLHAMGIYTNFYYAALDTNGSYAPQHPQSLATAINDNWAINQIPILLINHSYHSIRSDAASLGLFTTNVDTTILYDNTTRTISPYQKHRLFAGMPFFKGRDFASNGDVVFNILPTTMLVTDTIAGQIQIDFGDGNGYVNVTANTLKSIYYSSSGPKIINIKQGGLESTSGFNFIKNELFFNMQPFPTPSEEANRTLNRLGGSGTIVEREIGSSCDNTFDKPIIVVEGFNIEEALDARQLLNSLNPNGLVTQLRALGYDFVTVRFTNNTASIFDNAQALRQVIEDVNTEKAGSNKINIIGLSMGGLITKYCLKDMEDNSIAHNVENFFSYDAPHQGAYIPLGIQHLLFDASKALSQVKYDPNVMTLTAQLNSDAGTQLLQQHRNGVTVNGRNTFANTYAAKGYPTQCNNYGIANGRADGVGLGYPDAAQLLDFRAETYYLFRVYNHKQELYSTSVNNSTISYLRSSGFATSIFGPKGIYKVSSRVKFDGELSHETVPGSTAPFIDEYETNLLASFRGSADIWSQFIDRQISTFVPTASALDLNNQNYGANGFYFSQNPYYNLTTDSNPLSKTPFDDISYPSTSEEHLLMSPRVTNFVFEKIYGSPIPSTCAGICAATAEFSGLVNVCNVANPEITFTNMPSGVIVNWVLPSGLSVLSGQGTNSIRINHAATGTYTGGYVTLSRPGCPTASYGFTVQFTEPTSISGPAQLCTNSTYNIPNLPNGAVVTWEVIGSSAEITENYNDHVVLSGVDNGQVKLKATVVSSCGTHIIESPYINNGWPYYVTLTDIYNDGMGTSQGYLCSDAWSFDNYHNTFSYIIPSGSGTVTLHYQIYGSSGLVYSNDVTVTGTQILPNNLANGTYTLDVWISGGPCNLSTELSEVEIIYQSCDLSKISVYPNPANSELNISFSSEAKHMDISRATKQSFSVKLFNEKGRLVKEGRTYPANNREIRLQVADLPNGTYFLHVFEGKKVTKRQIIVAH